MHAAMAKGEKIMTLRALTLSGVAGLLFAAVSVSSEPALAQCGGCYAPAPVVVQPYVQSCGCCSCGGGAGYYGAGYAYGGYYGVAGSAYALDYGYGDYGGYGYRPRIGWRRGWRGY
jgi:hypothetical protein